MIALCTDFGLEGSCNLNAVLACLAAFVSAALHVLYGGGHEQALVSEM